MEHDEDVAAPKMQGARVAPPAPPTPPAPLAPLVPPQREVVVVADDTDDEQTTRAPLPRLQELSDVASLHAEQDAEFEHARWTDAINAVVRDSKERAGFGAGTRRDRVITFFVGFTPTKFPSAIPINELVRRIGASRALCALTWREDRGLEMVTLTEGTLVREDLPDALLLPVLEPHWQEARVLTNLRLGPLLTLMSQRPHSPMHDIIKHFVEKASEMQRARAAAATTPTPTPLPVAAAAAATEPAPRHVAATETADTVHLVQDGRELSVPRSCIVNRSGIVIAPGTDVIVVTSSHPVCGERSVTLRVGETLAKLPRAFAQWTVVPHEVAR
jgi:hypothetical protein